MDVAAVTKELREGDPYVRIYALKALGQEGGSQAREAIVRCLKEDPDPVVRHEAAFWLGEMGDPEATQALAETAAQDRDPVVRHECVEALGWIPTEPSRAAIERALEDQDEVVRLTAKISLAIHRHPREDWEKRIGQ